MKSTEKMVFFKVNTQNSIFHNLGGQKNLGGMKAPYPLPFDTPLLKIGLINWDIFEF